MSGVPSPWRPDIVRDMSNDTTAPVINPTCHACDGTGTDAAFGGQCSECERDASLAAQRFAGDGQRDRVQTPGERMDGRTFGGSTGNEPSDKQVEFARKLCTERGVSIDILAAEGTTKRDMSKLIDKLMAMPVPADDDGPAWCPNRASDKQIAFIESLIAERDRNDERTNAECETIEMLISTRQLNKAAASASIDLLKKAPRKAVEVEAGPVDGLDLSPLKAFTSRGMIRMGVPGGDTRLKIEVKFVERGKWAGYVFVKDAAEYGVQKRMGRQAPGGRYVGDIEAELAAILADPQAAVVRYAELTDRCGVCNTHLEDKASVARGMGPVCAAKFG